MSTTWTDIGSTGTTTTTPDTEYFTVYYTPGRRVVREEVKEVSKTKKIKRRLI